MMLMRHDDRISQSMSSCRVVRSCVHGYPTSTGTYRQPTRRGQETNESRMQATHSIRLCTKWFDVILGLWHLSWQCTYSTNDDSRTGLVV